MYPDQFSFKRKGYFFRAGKCLLIVGAGNDKEDKKCE
jgi:hypothetical protein